MKILKLITSLLLSLSLATAVSAASWTTVTSVDHEGQPFSNECDPPYVLMSENDYWYGIFDGSLGVGESFTFTHPRATCDAQAWPGRLSWRWSGNGKPPNIALNVVAPDGQTWTSSGPNDVYQILPGQPFVHAGRVYDVRTVKQGLPTSARLCLFEGPTAGNWTFTIINIGDKTASSLRVGAEVTFFEWTYTGCVTDDPDYAATGYWWPNHLTQFGL